MKPLHRLSLWSAAALVAMAGCTHSDNREQSSVISEPPLYSHYENDFVVGTALSRAQIMAGADADQLTEKVRGWDGMRGYYYEKTLIPDPGGLALAKHHFNAWTPENVMKWEEIHPEPGVYDFEAADRFVEMAEAQGKFITAHTLIWHNQTPDWVFENEEGETIGREALIERMRDHIHTIVGRYQGRIDSWDVVNEVIEPDGSYRESKWYEILGEEYIVKAFEFAHEADPEAELYYNDYTMENHEKRAGVVRMIEMLQDKGVPVTAVGNQSHYSMRDFPEQEDVEQVIEDFAALGVDVMVTELDINVLPSARDEDGNLKEGTDLYTDGLPAEVAEEQADRFRELFRIYREHSDKISRVTLWGHTDESSWLNYLPMERTNHPLIFDRDLATKPAFHAIVEAAE